MYACREAGFNLRILSFTRSMTSFVLSPVRATITPPTASELFFHERRNSKGVTDLDVRHLLDVDRNSVRAADDDLFDVIDGRK